MKINEIVVETDDAIEEAKRRRRRKQKFAYSGPGYIGYFGYGDSSSGEGGGDGGGGMEEGWSAKYKRSINCARPRGFSQRAHCQGRKKK